MGPSGLLVAVVAIGSFASYIIFAARLRGQVARGRTTVARGGFVATNLPLAVPIAYLVLAVRPGPELPVPDALRWLGLALVVGGIAFCGWSARTLGAHFDLEVEVHAGHEVVDRGPYAIVRHPVYLGLAVHFAGACLATGNLLFIAGTLLGAFPALYLRASSEEALLRTRLGAAYNAYARRVPMLVPLWRRGG